MKRKKILNKILLYFITFILIIYISFGLVFLSVFNISEKFLNRENVSDFISNLDIASILKNELGKEFNQYTLIEEELQNIGITNAGINEFMNSEDVKDFSGDVFYNILESIGTNQQYEISNDQVTDLFENNIDKLQTDSSLSQKQIMDKLNSKISDLTSSMNNLLDNLYDRLESSDLFDKYQTYINQSIQILDVVYSDIVYFIIISVLISFIVLLIFIRRNIYKSLKWLSISFIIPSILLYITSYILTNYINADSILINNIMSIVGDNLYIYSLTYFSISIIFVIINILIYIVKKYKDKKKVYYGKENRK